LNNRIARILSIALLFIIAGFLYQQYSIHFSGAGYDTPAEALPKDRDYVWIDGPINKKEHRYFFLADGKYYGTVVVKKTWKGWKEGEIVQGKWPEAIKENEISAAYSDEKILFGAIKGRGNILVEINGTNAEIVELNDMPKIATDLYQANEYSIWYVELKQLETREHFDIKVKNEKGKIISELSI